MPNQQVPSVGRIVHFVYGDKHLAAIITDPAFDDGERTTQALTVFPACEALYVTTAEYDASAKPGTWHWPEYVPAKDEASF